MSTFAIAALLLLLAVLAILLPPLLRRQEDGTSDAPAQHKDAASGDRHGSRHEELNLAVLRDQLRELKADLAAGSIGEDAYDSACRELERRVAHEVVAPDAQAAMRHGARSSATAFALAICIPLLAFVLYAALGTPQALDAAPANPHASAAQDVEAMVENLAQRLQDRPQDIEGWSMLARSYDALGRYEQAAAAYAHLLTLTDDDPQLHADLLADYADTLAMARGQTLQGEPERLILRALAIDPQHIKALALAGSAAFERRDYAAARAHWEKIMALAPADSDIARSTADSLRKAKARSGQAPSADVADVAEAHAAPASSALAGRVQLDPALRAQFKDSDPVFVFVRAEKGPRAPLAVLRKKVRDLPFNFVLDDSMAMQPGTKLSSHQRLVVGARVSRSGTATPQADEPQAFSEPVAPGSSGLHLTMRVAER